MRRVIDVRIRGAQKREQAFNLETEAKDLIGVADDDLSPAVGCLETGVGSRRKPSQPPGDIDLAMALKRQEKWSSVSKASLALPAGQWHLPRAANIAW